jgi:NAD(P)-dependent dehydrogenase (short-subunit alcohol dehydrogenase family)
MKLPRASGGRVVVVTGAGSGLGRALAMRFAAAGDRIAALDVDEAAVVALREELRGASAECLALRCDVTDPAACRRAIAATVERFGALDVLVNNAGVSHRSPFAATHPDVIRRVMDVNFHGAVHCTHAALPQLVASRGLVVAISSVAGYTPLVARTGYAASKHALHGFFDSLRSEVEPQGVGVSIVCPSFVATGIDRSALGGDGGPLASAKITVGRPLAPAEAAERIYAGLARRERLVLVGRTARQAWWLSRVAPRLYDLVMRRRLAGEVERP